MHPRRCGITSTHSSQVGKPFTRAVSDLFDCYLTYILISAQLHGVGNIAEFQRLTRQAGWGAAPGKVLYVGDHLASDLAEPATRHGWRTLMVLDEVY